MNELIKSTSKEAYDFFCEQGKLNRYGDITVTITMNDGVPVKLTKGFCEHISRRKTEKICEQNKNESKENDL